MEQPRDYASPEPYAFEHYNGVMPEHFGSDDWEDVDLPDDLPAPRSPWRAGAITLIGAAVIAGFALIAWPWKAKAQSVCMPFQVIADILKRNHDEEPIGRAVVNPTIAIVVFSAPEGKTFSILTVNPAGLACVLAGGFDWDVGSPPEKQGEGL